MAILRGNRSGRLEIPLNEKGQNPIYSTVTYSWVVTTTLTDFVCMGTIWIHVVRYLCFPKWRLVGF